MEPQPEVNPTGQRTGFKAFSEAEAELIHDEGSGDESGLYAPAALILHQAKTLKINGAPDSDDSLQQRLICQQPPPTFLPVKREFF